MKIRTALTISMMLLLLSGCDLPYPDLKSPCAGADGSPCARRPVNDWWLKQSDDS